MLQDLRFGLKLLWKEKTFTVAALVTLALCIGANTAIFTVLNAVVLEPLAYPEAQRLVLLGNIYPGVGLSEGTSNSGPDYFDRRQMTDVFESLAATKGAGFDVGAQGSSVRVDGQSVTPSFFRVLRAAPILGRGFTEEEAVFRQDRYAILSYGLWKDLFAKDPNVVGRDVRLSGAPYRIVGVMPEGFASPGSEARIWVPLSFSPEQMSDDARHGNNFGMIARLQPGISLAQARQQIDELNRVNLDRTPKLKKILLDARYATQVRPVKDVMVKDVRPTLYLLQAAVVFVLLIGCVNVANLLLVRSNLRMKELAVRFSLGAGRLRLARQLLTESIALAAGGGLLGACTGYAGVRLLAYLGSASLPRGADIAVNAKVLGFSALVAVLTGVVFGAVPVYHLMRRDLHAIFRGNERGGTAERRAVWTRSALVVCQVSLAFVLLIGSGLLTLSFARLVAIDPGFRPQHVMTAAFSVPRSRYPDDARARNLIGGMLERVRAIPGVQQVGLNSQLPFSGSHSDGAVQIEGYNSPDKLPPDPDWNSVDPGYFAAIGIPLMEGRTFSEGDTADTALVAVVDQYMAKRYWPRGNAVGGLVRRGLDPNAPQYRVIGVVGSVKAADLAESSRQGQIYFTYKQTTDMRGVRLVVKSAGDDPRLAAALRAELRRADSEIALFDVKSMEERLAASMGNRRAAMVICMVFAGLALLLSAIGIYGVLAYTVTQRTREFGIRIALGAGGRDVLRMVVGQGLKLAAVGLAVGIVGAFALTRLMTTMLFQVKPTDPAVYAVVGGGLMLVALAASLIPSLRAVGIHPSTALRYE
jgi:predicted permease